jgi:hypothetical protein
MMRLRLWGISVIVCISPFYPAEELLETIGEIRLSLDRFELSTYVRDLTSDAHAHMGGGWNRATTMRAPRKFN